MLLKSITLQDIVSIIMHLCLFLPLWAQIRFLIRNRISMLLLVYISNAVALSD